MLNNLARFVARLLISLFLGVAAHAQSPNPAIPVGNLSAYPMMVATVPHVRLVWSITLPGTASPGDYFHFIRQVEMADEITYDEPVNLTGDAPSPLPLGRQGSRFELWTIHRAPRTSHLLASTFISPYVPTARVAIRSEDPYSPLPRTRADRPFFVDVIVEGLVSGQDVPEISKGVSLLRHVQSYGATGTGANLNRNLATLISNESITTNGLRTLTFTLNSIPATNSAKARGEERFSTFTREDYQIPESMLDSKFIQIWPVADATITGLTPGQIIGATVPEITLTLNDIYPSSGTWAQVYKGGPQIAVTGTVLPGSSYFLSSPVPVSRVIKTSNYRSVFTSDGLWTMEILTHTPFGIDRLAVVSFTVESAGSPIEGWRQTHFGSTDNSGAGANLEDFDKDGLTNLVEYAFGFDPKNNSAGQLPAPQQLGNDAVISFAQPTGISGITYGAEWSTTLLPGSWTPIPDTATPPQHNFSVSIGTDPKLYLRMKVMTP